MPLELCRLILEYESGPTFLVCAYRVYEACGRWETPERTCFTSVTQLRAAANDYWQDLILWKNLHARDNGGRWWRRERFPSGAFSAAVLANPPADYDVLDSDCDEQEDAHENTAASDAQGRPETPQPWHEQGASSASDTDDLLIQDQLPPWTENHPRVTIAEHSEHTQSAQGPAAAGATAAALSEPRGHQQRRRMEDIPTASLCVASLLRKILRRAACIDEHNNEMLVWHAVLQSDTALMDADDLPLLHSDDD
jgi:hypothetical protein